MPEQPDYLSNAEHHLAEAHKWIKWTADGIKFDPVRDHANIALAYATLELARRWPAPTEPAASRYPEPHDEQDSA